MPTSRWSNRSLELMTNNLELRVPYDAELLEGAALAAIGA